MYGPVTVRDVTIVFLLGARFDVLDCAVMQCASFQKKQSSMATVADFDRSGVRSFFATHTL